MITAIAEMAKALIGSNAARKKMRLAKLSSSELKQSISHMPQFAAEYDRPIFVLSAGWRSGSTLLQRLVMSDPSVLIWGEIYDHSALVQKLASSLAPVSADWPPSNYLNQPDQLSVLANEWTANLYPPMNDLAASYRVMLDRLLRDPAVSLGADRWGMKEVRFGDAEARFIRWIYPQAKILMIYRNPYDAYSSYKSFSPARDWFARWPDKPVFTPSSFGRHWARLTSELLACAAELDGFVVKYEDLVSGDFDIGALAEYCETDIDQQILERRVGGSKSGEKNKLGWLESQLLRAWVHKVAEPLGYQRQT